MISGVTDLVPFLARWHAGLLERTSLDPSLVPADLPDALALLYRELGALIELPPDKSNDHRPPFSAQDGLVPASRLERVEGMAEFAWENQGNWSCRCCWEPGDPQVLSNAAESWDGSSSGFQVVCPSLDHFLVTLCLQEAVMSAPFLVSCDARTVEEALSLPLEPLWTDGVYVSGEPSHHFHRCPGHDVLVQNYAGIWVASHSADALDSIRPGVRTRRIA